MKTKIYVIALAMIACSFVIIACNYGSKPKATIVKVAGQKEVYSCEMHPEVIKDKPGNCPKCGMELTKKMVPDTTKLTN
jgi:Cu(I)/Ag(I) efflux system membrane fusion protein